MKKKLLAGIVAGILILGGAASLLSVRSGQKTTASAASYEFTTASRGTLETVVTSSGTLAPVSSVSVLSQMSGRVEKVFADYNDTVKKGQILVTLNTDMLELEQKEALADLNIAQANYNLAALDYQNNSTLAAKGLVSEYDLKASRTTLDVKKATLSSAQSALKVIETQLTQYAQIKSPIDGIVLEKDVDVGQSVVEGSSSNATALFTLAEDLSKMEIKAEVDELDIGSIKVGQSVRFTVEANSGKTYSGSVGTIRLVPETTDNVVNYYVIIKADNADGTLLPGMTANVEFIKETRENALLVQNSALRYQPSSLGAQEIQRMVYAAGLTDLSDDAKKSALAEYDAALKATDLAKSAGATKTSGLSGILAGGSPGGPGGFGNKKTASTETESATDATASAAAKKALWYLDSQGKLAVKMVGAGSTDGARTEILGADDLEGMKIILREKAE
ncbi:MAG TPA: efflux RND transporter periplasmic adaptor subunit [Rectinemataceae bacterium]|nr:efflux RND transporter periplasmic adaptor subunit [Rectinemataceae bacterium]